MKRQLPRRNEPRRPPGMTLRLQQAWRRDGEQPRPEPKKTTQAPDKAA